MVGGVFMLYYSIIQVMTAPYRLWGLSFTTYSLDQNTPIEKLEGLLFVNFQCV